MKLVNLKHELVFACRHGRVEGRTQLQSKCHLGLRQRRQAEHGGEGEARTALQCPLLRSVWARYNPCRHFSLALSRPSSRKDVDKLDRYESTGPNVIQILKCPEGALKLRARRQRRLPASAMPLCRRAGCRGTGAAVTGSCR